MESPSFHLLAVCRVWSCGWASLQWDERTWRILAQRQEKQLSRRGKNEKREPRRTCKRDAWAELLRTGDIAYSCGIFRTWAIASYLIPISHTSKVRLDQVVCPRPWAVGGRGEIGTSLKSRTCLPSHRAGTMNMSMEWMNGRWVLGRWRKVLTERETGCCWTEIGGHLFTSSVEFCMKWVYYF